MPIPMVVLLLLFCIVMLRNSRSTRALLSVTVVILVFLSSSTGSNFLSSPLEDQYRVNNNPIGKGCLILVLGNGHNDKVPGMAIQKLSPPALSRLSEGVRQFNLGQDCKLIFSGWGGDSSSESHAQVMAKAAIELGISADKIITFPLAKDTLDEAQYMKWEVGDFPFRLVTSATHMPRAMEIFLNLELSPEAAPTDFITREGYWWSLNAQNLLSSQRSIHEYVGKLWFRLKHEN